MAGKKHAYLIIAHNNFYTLSRLISMLDHERNDIFLHIDKKVENPPFEKLKGFVKKGRLIITKRIDVRWGHSTQVDCEMLLLKTAIKTDDYDYLHLISGVDLPIKSQEHILDFFDRNPDKQFLQVGWAENHLWRLNKFTFFVGYESNKRLFGFGENISSIICNKFKYDRLKKYGNMKVVKTCNWFSITGECAKYIVSKRHFIRKLTRHTVCADEMFLGTVIFNSPFAHQVYNPEPSWDGHMRYIDRINNVGSSPHTLVMADKDILDSSEMLFARKFDEDVDEDIIEYIYKKYKD